MKPGQNNQAAAIGIDLGGTTVRTGIYNSRWQLLRSITQPTRVADGPSAVVSDMAASVQELAEAFDFFPEVIGLGSPGPIDLTEGNLLQLPNFPGWDYFPIRAALCAATGASVVLESDANAAAYAEFRAGAGAELGADSMCMLTLGTGVGSGLILNGKLWHGMRGMAGELGHVSIFPSGPVCPCGSRGCLERYASATAIAEAGRQRLRDAGPNANLTPEAIASLTTRGLADLASAGHVGMKALFEEVGYYLGLSIASVVNTLNLPLYVVGGGVAEAWDLFAPALFRAVREHSYVYQLSEPLQTETPEPGRPFITRARLGTHAGLLGAAMVSLLAAEAAPRPPAFPPELQHAEHSRPALSGVRGKR